MASDQPSVGSRHAQHTKETVLTDEPIGDLGVLTDAPVVPAPAGLACLDRAVEIVGTRAREERVAEPSGGECVRIATGGMLPPGAGLKAVLRPWT